MVIKKSNNGTLTEDEVVLKKQHPKFGTVLCDNEGNYYIVTGEDNETDDTDVETIFISKYDSFGNHVKTVGDNGSSSLAYYYHDGFYTQSPFEAGNCEAAISNDILTVNYARLMYSGHQSNSVFSVNIKNMTQVPMGEFYESHSFAQRVVATREGFVYMSEGDCFDRTFQAYFVKNSGNNLSYSREEGIFDFWVEDGAYDAYDMMVVNNNFAHMGGMVSLSNGNIAFVAQSARSLCPNARAENEDVFIQIFEPYKKLNTPDSYVTRGTRSGLAGNNGRTNVTNYGVKWITNDGRIDTGEINSRISNVQIVSTDKDEIVVLYERRERYYEEYDYNNEYIYFDGEYKGIYYTVLDKNGNVLYPETLLSDKAMLNPCRMPIYLNGKIYWVGNECNDYNDNVYIYSMRTDFEQGEEKTETNTNVATTSIKENTTTPITSKNLNVETTTTLHQETHNFNATTKETEKENSTQSNSSKSNNNQSTVVVKKSITQNKMVKLTLKIKNQKVKYKKLKKKKIVLKNAIRAKLGNYKLHYYKEGGSSRLKVNSKGHIIVKKGTKKGTYKIIVNIWSFNLYGYCDKNVKIKVKVN